MLNAHQNRGEPIFRVAHDRHLRVPATTRTRTTLRNPDQLDIDAHPRSKAQGARPQHSSPQTR
jgi:hypothetical protein